MFLTDAGLAWCGQMLKGPYASRMQMRQHTCNSVGQMAQQLQRARPVKQAYWLVRQAAVLLLILMFPLQAGKLFVCPFA